jgi:hypothetical protein
LCLRFGVVTLLLGVTLLALPIQQRFFLLLMAVAAC